ncbi:MAG: DNA primase [Thermodesulfobacteriota bacterium]|nr:DNA primase [Thermodesulfobacteriota bacterium]
MTGYIPDEKIAEIKERANIIDVVSDYVSLDKTGRSYKGLCPFHTEKTPSFTVNEEKQVFYCFGCNAGGNVFSFIMKMDNLSFPEATRELAKRYGISIPRARISETEKKETTKKEKLFELNNMAAFYYHHILKNEEDGKEAREYLQSRGIGSEVIADHRLGYAPNVWNGLSNFFTKKEVPFSLAEEVGLQIPKKAGGFYDRFRGRIIFPIINIHNKIAGFGGRVLNDDLPKYLNSPESPIYHKSKSLYGLNIAKDLIRSNEMVIIVEGYLDLLALNQYGIKNVVATLGTALTQYHIDTLKRYTKNMITIFDADEAGKKAAARSLEIFLKQRISPKIGLLPSGYDPDSFVRERGKEAFLEIIAGSIPLVEFVINQTMKKYDISSVEGRRDMIKEVSPILMSISDEIERELYAQEVSSRLGLRDTFVLLKPVGTKKKEIDLRGEGFQAIDDDLAERLLLQLMLLRDDVVHTIREEGIIEEFTNTSYRHIGLLFLDVFNKEGKLEPIKIINLLEDESSRGLVSQFLLEEESILDVDKTLENCICKIRMNKVRHEIRVLDQRIKEAQKRKDDVRWREFLVSRQKLMDKQRDYRRAFSPLNT